MRKIDRVLLWVVGVTTISLVAVNVAEGIGLIPSPLIVLRLSFSI